MARELLMVRQGVNLIPADQLAEEDILAFSDKRPIMVEARHPRSPPHHRLLFGLLRKVARSTPTPLNEDALRAWVLVRTGNVDILPLGFGKVYEAPKSMAFRNMDQVEFRALFDAAVKLILEEVAPGLPDSFADEFLAMLEKPNSLSARDTGAERQVKSHPVGAL